MELALKFQDEKFNKFWRVETDGCAMLTNWGKVGANGRWQLAEYGTKEECERQAAKLAASKGKKGYRPMPEFNRSAQTYFDLDAYGLHPLTSHPTFRAYFSNQLYYNCADEEAPFGSDEGNDTLHILEENYKPKLNFANFPRWLIQDQWELTYFPPAPNQTDQELQEQAAKSVHGLPGEQEILQTDQVILATALGQIKISGKIDGELLKLALQSLNRWERMYRLLWNWDKAEPPYHIGVMRHDLEHFAKEQTAF